KDLFRQNGDDITRKEMPMHDDSGFFLRACCKIKPFSPGLARYQLVIGEDHMRRSSSWTRQSCLTTCGSVWNRCFPRQGRIAMFSLPVVSQLAFVGSLLVSFSSCELVSHGVAFQPPVPFLPVSPACATCADGREPGSGSACLNSCSETFRPNTESIGTV